MATVSLGRLIANQTKCAATMCVLAAQVVSDGPVRLIPNVPLGNVAVAVDVLPAQVVLVTSVRLFPIVPAMKVAVTTYAKLTPAASGILVPPTLIAELRKPVVTELANTRTMIVMIPPP